MNLIRILIGGKKAYTQKNKLLFLFQLQKTIYLYIVSKGCSFFKTGWDYTHWTCKIMLAQGRWLS